MSPTCAPYILLYKRQEVITIEDDGEECNDDLATIDMSVSLLDKDLDQLRKELRSISSTSSTAEVSIWHSYNLHLSKIDPQSIETSFKILHMKLLILVEFF